MRVSIITGGAIDYPPSVDGFSPSERYPEYALDEISLRPNPVYRQVRELFVQLGLDAPRLGTPHWNPLGAFLTPGANVFVLCNFVFHRREQETEQTFQAKCIHGSVLRALIDYVLLAVGHGGSVRFGNAPLQSCDWSRVREETGAARVAEFYAKRGLPVAERDLRLHVAAFDPLGRVTSVERRDEQRACTIDLGPHSLLAQIGAGSPHFRVTDYDPRRTESFHTGGRHCYVVHRDVLESDAVVSLSKLKTHEKVGITCGLKGFVGAVGHKDSLAHHRFGAPSRGGDEYPDRFRFLRPLSWLHDRVYSRAAGAVGQGLVEAVDRTLRTAARRGGAITGGAWHGNDTAWRMALDLARILHFADRQGAMRDVPQRRHLSLIDGIVAGEAEGPLDPTAVAAGTLLFGDDVAAVDRVACRLMGFDPSQVPLIRKAFELDRWPITELTPDADIGCILDAMPRPESALSPVLGRPFAAPTGWRARLTPPPSSAARLQGARA